MTPIRGPKASHKAADILKRPLVKFHLEEQFQAQVQRCLLSSDRVIQEIMRLAFYNIKNAYDAEGNPLPVDKLPSDLTAALEGFETEERFDHATKKTIHVTKYKFAQKRGPLTMLAEHLRLLVQKFEVSGPNGTPLPASKVDLSDVTTALLERIVAKAE